MHYLVIFLFTSLTLFAKPSVKKIESITYRSQQGATLVLIQLTDKSVWKWTPGFYDENLLRRWEEGDEVLIQATCHPGFHLKNIQRPHFIPNVALSYNSYLLFPTIISCNQSAGLIKLSDDTVWQILYAFNKKTLSDWSLGDRIICTAGIRENYQLINIDIPPENRNQIERFIEVAPFDPTSQ